MFLDKDLERQKGILQENVFNKKEEEKKKIRKRKDSIILLYAAVKKPGICCSMTNTTISLVFQIEAVIHLHKSRTMCKLVH